MRLLLAIPCLNEAQNIDRVIKSIPREQSGISGIDILVVDDGSTDNTGTVASCAGAAVITHKTNKGLGIAFRTAVDYAISNHYDIMVNMDGDGQFCTDDIVKLIAPIIEKSADVVTASRFIEGARLSGISDIKYFGNKVMSSIISSLCNQKYYDVSCGFRAYSKEALYHINLHGRFTYTQESFIAFAFYGLTVLEVPASVQYFKDRKSRIAGNLFKYGARTFSLIFDVYRDYYPLRFFGAGAGFFGIISLIFAALLFGNYFINGTFSGYYFAALLAGFFGILTVICLVLGIALQTVVRLQRNQERILYLLKRNNSLN